MSGTLDQFARQLVAAHLLSEGDLQALLAVPREPLGATSAHAFNAGIYEPARRAGQRFAVVTRFAPQSRVTLPKSHASTPFRFDRVVAEWHSGATVASSLAWVCQRLAVDRQTGFLPTVAQIEQLAERFATSLRMRTSDSATFD